MNASLSAADSAGIKANILLVDDDRSLLRSVSKLFTSPNFSIATADSLPDAIAKIKASSAPWHCWVLDIDLGEGQSGLDIMSAYPNFPFVVILSGMQSMHVASEAIAKGALCVFDKNPDLLNTLLDAVCKVCALGYVLGGTATQHLYVYRLLEKSVVKSSDEWAELACMTTRHLHRICALHAFHGIRSTLDAYYGVYSLLAGASAKSGGDVEYFQTCLQGLLSGCRP